MWLIFVHSHSSTHPRQRELDHPPRHPRVASADGKALARGGQPRPWLLRNARKPRACTLGARAQWRGHRTRSPFCPDNVCLASEGSPLELPHRIYRFPEACREEDITKHEGHRRAQSWRRQGRHNKWPKCYENTARPGKTKHGPPSKHPFRSQESRRGHHEQFRVDVAGQLALCQALFFCQQVSARVNGSACPRPSTGSSDR